MRQLTQTQCKKIRKAAEDVDCERNIFSCIAVHGRAGKRMAHRYADFYNRECYGCWRTLYSIDRTPAEVREQRVFLLLLFAETKGKL
jgi:hypothetical protein